MAWWSNGFQSIAANQSQQLYTMWRAIEIQPNEPQCNDVKLSMITNRWESLNISPTNTFHRTCSTHKICNVDCRPADMDEQWYSHRLFQRKRDQLAPLNTIAFESFGMLVECRWMQPMAKMPRKINWSKKSEMKIWHKVFLKWRFRNWKFYLR